MAQVQWRWRDVGVVALALLAILASWSRSFSLTPSLAWVLESQVRTTTHSGVSAQLHPPFVADLDGDGAQELVMLREDLLSVHELPATSGGPARRDQNVIHRVVVTEAAQRYRGALGAAGRTVTYGVGFLDPYDEKRARQQYVAVLRDDWTVLLFDHELRLLWRKEVPGFDPPAEAGDRKRRAMRDGKILLSPRCSRGARAGESKDLREVLKHGSDAATTGAGCGGTVLVTAHMAVDHAKDHLHLGLEAEGPAKAGAHNETVNHALDELGVVALEGKTGGLAWVHRDGEQDAKSGKAGATTQGTRKLPAWQYKHAVETRPIEKEMHWTNFRRSVLRSVFPHAFTSQHMDLNIGFLKLERGNPGHGKEPKSSGAKGAKGAKSPKGSKIKGKPGVLSKGMNLAALAPGAAQFQHREEEHTKSYNGIFVRHAEGIEILSLRHGRHVSSINLRTHTEHFGAYYADINGDSIVDSVTLPTHPDVRFAGGLETDEIDATEDAGHTVHTRNEGVQSDACITVLSGLPSRQQLYHSHVPCREDIADALDASTMQGRRRRSRRRATQGLHFAPPVFLTRRRRGGGRGQARSYDVVVASNDGIVTSLAPDGSVNWQTADGVEFDHGRASRFSLQGYSMVMHPDDSHATGDRALFIGSREWVIIGHAGEVLARGNLLQPVRVKPRIEDVNNDGVYDIVLLGDEVVWALQLSMGSRVGLGIGIPVLILLLLSLFVFVMQMRDSADGAYGAGLMGSGSGVGSGSGRGTNQGSFARGAVRKITRPLFYVKRSTD